MKKHKDTVAILRQRYLASTKNMVVAAHRRHGLLDVELAVCLSAGPEPDDLLNVVAANKDIAQACNAMRKVEIESNHVFGVQLLLGEDAADPIRTAIALLAAKAVTDAVTIHTVASLADIAAGSDENDLVTIHEAMRRGGLLRAHVEVDMSRARNLGELADPALTESAFRTLLGLGPDTECAELGEARNLFSRMQAERRR